MSNTMTQYKMFRILSAETGLSRKQCFKIIGTLSSAIAQHLADGGRVKLRGLGVFDLKTKGRVVGKNMNTGEIVDVPAHKKVRFRACKELHSRVIRLPLW